MTQGQSYSYLDLSVHPALSKHVLSSDATVLFSGPLDTIYWANAAGAKLFGGKGVVELLDANLSDDHAFVRQLRATIGQIEDNQPIIRGFRIAQGLRSALLQFEITPVSFADGNLCYKITQRAEADSTIRGEHARAVAAVESLEGFADASAIVDDYGLPIATTRDFGRLGPSEESLLALTAELREEEDCLIKREIRSASGKSIIAGLGRFATEPGRNLIVVARGLEEVEEVPVAPSIDISPTRESERPKSQDDAQREPVIESESEDRPETETEPLSFVDGSAEEISSHDLKILSEFEELEATLAKTVEASESEGAEPSNTEEVAGQIEDPSEDITADDTQPVFHDEPESLNEADQLSEKGFEIDANEVTSDKADASSTLQLFDKDTENSDSSSETSTSGPSQEHARFAWTTDENSVFTSVSPELAESVGEQAANIVGRRWEDIATVFGFDTSGEISELLVGKDTWSGKTVLWPIEGTDMVAPVDLAALPAFDSEREFRGFKGFGIIRNIDAIVDPEEIGIALKPIPGATIVDNADQSNSEATETESSSPDKGSQTRLWFELESDTPATDNVTDTEAEPAPSDVTDIPDDSAEISDNVVQFFPSKADTAEGGTGRVEIVALEDDSETLASNSNAAESQSFNPREPDTSLISKLPLAVLVYRDEKLLFANEKLLEISGYTDIDDIEKAGGLNTLIEPSVQEESSKSSSNLITFDGTRIPINPVLHTVPWDREKALQLSFNPPATIAKTPTKSTSRNETQYSEIQAILDTTSDGIVLLETGGEIISLNAPGEALFNVTFDEANGQHLTALFAKEHHGAINQYINALSGSGLDGLLQEGLEVGASVKDSGEIPVFLALAKLENSEKLCAVVRDLTSWKKTEQELVKSRHDAERASEQKTDLLAQVSHEIRIPLTAIIGFSDIMIEERFGAINNERYREYLRDINKSGKHVLDLVNDLLDLSKIESGKLELTFDAVDLNTVVSEAVSMLQAQANENRIIVRTSLSRAVPKVVADERSVRQVVLNLVTNAIKFSSSNSQVIVSTVYESNGEVALRIRDAGPGMSEAEIEEAMKPYHQLSRIKSENTRGTGLGLPLTKALVEANRAYFDLESEPGAGTIVHVQFPVQRVLAD